MSHISVIIPVGPDESTVGRLVGDLLLLPRDTELLFVTCRSENQRSLNDAMMPLLAGYRVRWIEAPQGRAQQQNAGAAAATGDLLWFLHWDSGFGPLLVQRLLVQLRAHPDRLHYAELAFMDDGPRAARLNALGANLRSRWLKTPFGDQGFALSRRLFDAAGGFDEKVAYGEDHLLVWGVRFAGGELQGCQAPLYTSARKYRTHGWCRLTLRYQWLWLYQAAPCGWRWFRQLFR